MARNNGWKGYVPSLTQQGSALIVIKDADAEDYIRKGFVRVGDYPSDPNENSRAPRGYYMSSVAGKAAYRQGIAQTVHESWQGVDARTGQSLPGKTAGLFLGAGAARLAREIDRHPGNHDGQDPAMHLLPILDENGEVVAYERPMDPAQLAKLPKDTHLGRMLGVWAGRIVEENISDEINTTLVQTLKQIWDGERKKGETGRSEGSAHRTDLLASFMALAQVDTDLRETLGKMKPPKVAELQWGSVDDWVRSIMAMATNLITRLSLKPRLARPCTRLRGSVRGSFARRRAARW
ncbi:hypothetical protein GI374_16870 [Paracoccus sp. S-4012]|uniref:hypothetical protein n=1 Tax=Paracoccus sp. S-4012 TaxID=2665648 RepID=UPI0012B10D6E|nr:hypothetical protein [Paracoccus sp. S-4012]MRX52052.1 hypothetical protein [Paracoccus sp. S-4012]